MSHGILFKYGPGLRQTCYSWYDVRDLLEEMAPGGSLGDVHWSFSEEEQSIFEVYCLRVWRKSASDS
jgi:hypothetical protein